MKVDKAAGATPDPDLYGFEAVLPRDDVLLRQRIRGARRLIDRLIEEHPGRVVERRDSYLVVEGEDRPVMLRSHVIIDTRARPDNYSE